MYSSHVSRIINFLHICNVFFEKKNVLSRKIQLLQIVLNVFMKDLQSRFSEATGEKCAKYFLFQSLSMTLQRGNARYVKGTQ